MAGGQGEGCEYRELWWHNSSGGLGRWPYLRGDLREHYWAGFRAGLWHPEYHGRAHFDTRAWTAYLRAGDEVAPPPPPPPPPPPCTPPGRLHWRGEPNITTDGKMERERTEERARGKRENAQEAGRYWARG